MEIDPKLLICGISAVMFLVGFFTVRSRGKKRSRCRLPVTGTVVEVNRIVESDDSNDKTIRYVPVYEFTAGNTQVRRQGNVVARRRQAFQIGETKPLLCNPEKPEEFIEEGSSKGGGGGVALMVIAAVMAAVVLLADKINIGG